LVNGGENTVDYLKQILPHGFESISITFWQKVDVDIVKFAAETRKVVEDAGAVISSVSCFGNPLERREIDDVTRKGWETLIDNAHLFGCDIVTGFAGRLIDVPIDQQMDRYAEVWGPLAKRAADKGVRIAFENCDMGGTWQKGDWNIAMTPIAWEMMFNAIPSDNVGLQWEPCHQMVKLIDPIPQLRKYVKKVFALHGKDATVNWDVIRETGIIGPNQFAFHRTPGFGDSNWTDIITILRMAGFKGSIDIEGWHDPVYRGELEMMGQVHGLNYLKACRGGSFVPNPE
jgi:sugar phosphate isomerase/epimerase